jgi:hypothetical protein
MDYFIIYILYTNSILDITITEFYLYIVIYNWN